ncbi:phospholipase D-like domain-containing protein [Saprospira grandis]|uniref:phospholipase D n=1 Tax=Saprospira grandis (strain Lewin) TaxID=984262 RepID=H6L494_SAPGL|nr:phospholipase D-like domain-containing protein [Saprospira grandis]AFC25078.1 phospholipase D/Transphosphatidylase [Saprospira grandis str. Lewin]
MKTLLPILFVLAFAPWASAQFVIFGEAVQSNISNSGFTVSYNTSQPGEGILEYGLTPSLEMGFSAAGPNASSHQVALSGLQAAEVYYVRPSLIRNGDTIPSTKTAIMATASNSTGQIKIFFNKSIDVNVSNGTYPHINNSSAAIVAELIKRIDSAQTSIDVAAYNINQANIVTALNNAQTRGVVVRYIANDGTSNSALSNANFPYEEVNNTGLMHNKFLVFDAGSVYDSYVWTGSMNLTSGNIYDDFNNVVLVQDQTLAKAYSIEFNEMWGSTTTTFDVVASRVGGQKADNTPHLFMIGGKLVEQYFSPSDNTTTAIKNAVLSAGGDVSFALLTFTNNELRDAVLDRQQSGEQVAGIIENIGDLGSDYNDLNAAGVDVYADNQPHDIHHKYAIIDANTPNSDPQVVTGSHNWSQGAEDVNDENTLIIHDAEIANWYLQEFSARYCANEGSSNCQYDPAVSVWQTELESFKVYPNPSQGQIQIELDQEQVLDYQLLNSLGQSVLSGQIQGQQAQLSLNQLPKGSYYLVLYKEGQAWGRQLIQLF